MRDLLIIKDKIIEAMLPDVAAQGWSWEAAENAATEAGLQDKICKAVFPEGVHDIVAHFSDLVDRRMLEKLELLDQGNLRVRDRIRTAILARFEIVESLKAEKALKASLAYWALPISGCMSAAFN